MFCANNCILSEYSPGVKISPLPCRCWSCQDCQPKRCARLRSEAYRGHPNTFITLTVNPQIGQNPQDRAQKLVEAWRKVRRKARKLEGNKTLPFLAVIEETQEGEPHLHILCRVKWIPQAWLSREMDFQIGAPVCDIRRVNSKKKAARYVAKYIGKNPEKYAGCKRYWRSQDYIIEERQAFNKELGEPVRSWWVKGNVNEVVSLYTRKFYRVEEYDLPGGFEYWLVDDWPSWCHERPPPQEKSADLFVSVASGVHPWSGG